MKSSKEGTRCIQVEITPTASRISRNAVTSMSIRGHRWKRHGKKHAILQLRAVVFLSSVLNGAITSVFILGGRAGETPPAAHYPEGSKEGGALGVCMNENALDTILLFECCFYTIGE